MDTATAIRDRHHTASWVANALMDFGLSPQSRTHDWYDMYKQRTRLRANWRAGRFVALPLPALAHQEEGHSDHIYAIRISGPHLLSGSVDKTIRVWDLSDHRLIGQPMCGHTGAVLCLDFDSHPGGDVIFSGDHSGQLMSWRFSTQTMIAKVDVAHDAAIIRLKFDETVVITASADQTIKVWDRNALCSAQSSTVQPRIQPQRILIGHCGSVNAIDFSGDVLVSASNDRTVRIWSVSEGKCIRTIEEPRSLACVKLIGGTLISGGRRFLTVYDNPRDPKQIRRFGHEDVVRTVEARHVKGSIETVVFGSYDGSIMVWMGTEDGKWQSRRLHVGSATSSGGGNTGLETCLDSTHEGLRDLMAAQPRPRTRAASDGRVEASVSPRIFEVDFNSRWLACCFEGSNIAVWDFQEELYG